MAGVEGIEQGSCLDSTHFAENDSVWSPAQSGLQKVIKRNVGLERVGLAFGRHNVRLLDVKFGGVLNDHDAILVRNEVSQYPQERGLAGPRPTADEQGLSAADLFPQEVRKWPCQCAASDQVIYRVMPAGELSDCQSRGRAHNRRNHRSQPASVWELHVQQGIVLV